MKIGKLATFPERLENLIVVLDNLKKQLDQIYVVLNEYSSVPSEIKNRYKNVEFKIPEDDLKDVGKFIDIPTSAEDYIFYLDDDISYPKEYVNQMIEIFESLPIEKKAIGVHGVIYSDFFDGIQQSRLVFPFNKKQLFFKTVNQLGTGTVLCKGSDTPKFNYMKGSEKFVDVRFSMHCADKSISLISIPRPNNWLEPLDTEDEGIFNTFTKSWPDNVTKEAREIFGFSKLDTETISIVEKLNTEN